MQKTLLFLLVPLALLACSPQAPRDEVVTISIVGINDVHGQLNASDQSGGLVAIASHVDALRAARSGDGGAVLVVDAGDMWQGTLESNLVEGASMVAAYNALDVVAAAIGNHEFDFGPAGPKPVPMTDKDDPRGALKQRAREAEFPLLAANLIDNETGQTVAWDNVRGSTMVAAAGVRIGIIGVTTRNSLLTTIAANTGGLSVAPLAETITREAAALRRDGAALVIVVAHAGGRCQSGAAPRSPCALRGELADVARALDPGAVDHIFGGHVDNAMAEIVNGISVSMNRGKAQSFGRVDFRIDRRSGRVVDRRIFPPQLNPVERPATYEGQPLLAAAGVASIAKEASALAAELENEPVGVELVAAFPLSPDMNSALFNLVTEALLDSFEADIAMHNVRGGLRAGLPAGQLTFSDVYEMFPFDNFAAKLEIGGGELRRVIAAQALRSRRVGFAGMRVFVECADSIMSVRMVRTDGSEIRDEEDIVLLVNDFLALGGDDILTPIIPPGGFELRFDLPRTRDALVNWLRARGGKLDPTDWRSDDDPKWNPGDKVPSGCKLPG
jgi:5'-nucleotidase